MGYANNPYEFDEASNLSSPRTTTDPSGSAPGHLP
jgi:hypothetical protein